jgi:hypothetical protein
MNLVSYSRSVPFRKHSPAKNSGGGHTFPKFTPERPLVDTCSDYIATCLRDCLGRLCASIVRFNLVQRSCCDRAVEGKALLR